MPTMTEADQTIACRECQKDFVFTLKEQKFYSQEGLEAPRRCHDCRNSRRSQVVTADPARGNTTGTVKWFDAQKGYGYITPDNEHEDAFVHYQQIMSRDRRRNLAAGQRVRFNRVKTAKGWQATEVSVMEPS